MKFKYHKLIHMKQYLIIVLSYCIVACNNTVDDTNISKNDTLSEVEKHLPENALKGLVVADELEIKKFATEPMLQNPTNIDVDERGRVWVTEAYNYRPAISGNPTNPKGDRIMILEDIDGDGNADTSKIFYQDSSLNAPLGICVLGNKVIVSQSPYIWAIYDDNNDDKADRKEIMFSGIGGDQHDHGAHAITFGADGKLYFNIGNEGHTLKDKDGKDILDQAGDVIGPTKYKQGMVFRCNTDGSNVECLGNNFRNPFEVAVDSYGTLWQSDNDDDGNQGTRINYVMPYGNYGYTDEITGEGWDANRINIEDSIPLRHWHLNDPGEIPNLLQTGAGSPTGMLIYEGDLLPKKFQGQMIHCDAGPNVVRSYPVTKNGAGYTAEIINIVEGKNDKWFRPSDVCVAPDGSLIIADWYDPGVGGHQAGDQIRGRIYRIAPKETPYKIKSENYTTPEGAVHALCNPNLSIRYHAYNVLMEMGASSVPALEKKWSTSDNPRFKARAFWALVRINQNEKSNYIKQAISNENSDIRILGIRAATELGEDLIPIIRQLSMDKNMQVKRECAIALRHLKSSEAAPLWANLAAEYTGEDRWFLEALGIGADKQWDTFLPAYMNKINSSLNHAGAKDIIWRARTDKSIPLLASLASDSSTSLKNRLRYFRAFEFNSGSLKYQYLAQMLHQNKNHDIELSKTILYCLNKATVLQSIEAQKSLQTVLINLIGTQEYIDLVRKFEVKTENKNLLAIAISKCNEDIGVEAAEILLKVGGSKLIAPIFKDNDTSKQYSLITSLSKVGSKKSVEVLEKIMISKSLPKELRKKAAQHIGKSDFGETRVLFLLKTNKIPAVIIKDVVKSVEDSWRTSVKQEALSYISVDHTPTKARNIPTIGELTSLKPNSLNGKTIFMNNCASCHMVNEIGKDFGPKLSAIGSKLPKEAILESIVNPSSGIGFGYEGWSITLKDGSTTAGIISGKTDDEISIKYPGGVNAKIKTSDIKSKKQMEKSMMTAGLYENFSNQGMADLLEYLSALKK